MFKIKMRFRLENRHYFAMGTGLFFLFITFILFAKTPLFPVFLGLSVLIGLSQFFIDLLNETRIQKGIENQFPNFVRNFVGNVKSGIPVARAAIEAANADYGELNPFVQRLKYQLEWHVPFHEAFTNFANSTHNPLVIKSISTVVEAEKSGGDIGDILESVTDSLVQIRKLKSQREAAMHSQVVQNYIIFFVFVIVIIVIQNFLIPYMSKTSSLGSLGFSFMMGNSGNVKVDFSSMGSFMSSASNWFISTNGIFLMMSLIQAFFAGIVTGLMTEGDMKYGLKHSVILMIMSFFLISIAQVFL